MTPRVRSGSSSDRSQRAPSGPPTRRQRPSFHGKERVAHLEHDVDGGRVAALRERGAHVDQPHVQRVLPDRLRGPGVVEPVQQRAVDGDVPHVGHTHQVEVEQVAVEGGQGGAVDDRSPHGRAPCPTGQGCSSPAWCCSGRSRGRRCRPRPRRTAGPSGPRATTGSRWQRAGATARRARSSRVGRPLRRRRRRRSASSPPRAPVGAAEQDPLGESARRACALRGTFTA